MTYFFLGCLAGLAVSLLLAWVQISECADCAVGNIDRAWWRKAVVLAEFRKDEAARRKE